MTSGLLISRKNKNKLHKKSIASPTEFNISNYKKFRNIYNLLLRKSKIMYYESNINLMKRTQREPGKFLRKPLAKNKTKKFLKLMSMVPLLMTQALWLMSSIIFSHQLVLGSLMRLSRLIGTHYLIYR